MTSMQSILWRSGLISLVQLMRILEENTVVSSGLLRPPFSRPKLSDFPTVNTPVHSSRQSNTLAEIYTVGINTSVSTVVMEEKNSKLL